MVERLANIHVQAWDQHIGRDGATAILNALDAAGLAIIAPIVYVVVCVDGNKETRHIFSTQPRAQAYMDSDPRSHVLYDYVLDCPERHEQVQQ